MSDVSIITESSKERHRRIRAAFIAQGTSFQGWCKTNGIHPPNAHKAMNGQWVGPKATELVERIIEAAKAKS